MAIRIVTGVPGSGKTYYVVHHIWKNYLQDKDLLLVHNIDELKIPVSAKIEDGINKAGGAENFFTVDKQEKYLKKLGEKYPDRTKFVYVIDECQRWLSRRLKISNDVYYFFQYHRHLGLDLWLITQDIANLPQEIRDLAELEISAVPRSLIPFFNLYSQKIKGVHIKSVFRRKLQAVYDLYSHASANEVEQPKSWLLPKMIAFIVIPIVLFWYGINSFGSSGDKNTQIAEKSVAVADIPVSGLVDEFSPAAERWRPANVVVISDHVGNQIVLVVDSTGVLVPIEKCDYPLKALKTSKDGQVRILAFMPGNQNEYPENPYQSRVSDLKPHRITDKSDSL